MKINELIKQDTNDTVAAVITNYVNMVYNLGKTPPDFFSTVYSIEWHLNADNECITDNINVAAEIIGDRYFQYVTAMQDFNHDTKREELLQSISKINSEATQTATNLTNEQANSNNQAYVQNQSQETDTAGNNNKFRDSATENSGSSTSNSDTSAKQSTDTTQVSNPALIRFTRELRNLNIFAGKLGHNFIRTCILDLSLPFYTEGENNRGLSPYFTYE